MLINFLIKDGAMLQGADGYPDLPAETVIGDTLAPSLPSLVMDYREPLRLTIQSDQSVVRVITSEPTRSIVNADNGWLDVRMFIDYDQVLAPDTWEIRKSIRGAFAAMLGMWFNLNSLKEPTNMAVSINWGVSNGFRFSEHGDQVW